MSEPTYTLDQLMQMIRFTRHSKANGRQAYKTRDSILTAFGRACKRFEDTHGNSSLKNEYVRRRNSNSLTKEFLDRIFPYFPSVTSFEGKPLKVIDYSLATTEADPQPTVPPIDPAYTARVVEASERRELEKELAEIYMTIDAIDLNSDPFPVDLGEAARWLGYSGEARQAKYTAKTLLLAEFVEQVDYKVCQTSLTNPPSGGRPTEQIRLTSECFKKFCLKAGTKRAERVREYFIAAEQRFRALTKSDAIQVSTNPDDIENVVRRVVRNEAEQQLTAAVGEIGENLGSVEVKVLTVLEIMQQQFNQQIESLRLEVTKSQTPAVADLKRLHGKLYQDVLEQAYRYQDGIHCPCCNKATTTWEIDHWRSKADPARTNGWKVCRSCNQALGAAGDSTKRDKYKNRFDAFQMRCDDYEQYLNGDEIKQLGLL